VPFLGTATEYWTVSRLEYQWDSWTVPRRWGWQWHGTLGRFGGWNLARQRRWHAVWNDCRLQGSLQDICSCHSWTLPGTSSLASRKKQIKPISQSWSFLQFPSQFPRMSGASILPEVTNKLRSTILHDWVIGRRFGEWHLARQ
jgi:hypothetical protein